METLKAKKKNGQMDFLLYVTVLLLCAFGLVMVFSASYYYAQNKASLNYDGLYYLKNQAKYMAMGLGVMIVMSRVDYHYLEKLRNVGLMVTLLLMLATVFWGEDINGAKRWLNLFDVITFQPSELAKFVLILYMASFMTRRAPQMKSFTRGIVPMLIIMCIICILLLLQKNMSMMMVVMMIGFVMLLLGKALRHRTASGVSAGNFQRVPIIIRFHAQLTQDAQHIVNIPYFRAVEQRHLSPAHDSRRQNRQRGVFRSLDLYASAQPVSALYYEFAHCAPPLPPLRYNPYYSGRMEWVNSICFPYFSKY